MKMGVASLSRALEELFERLEIRADVEVLHRPDFHAPLVRIRSGDLLTVSDFVDAAWEKNR